MHQLLQTIQSILKESIAANLPNVTPQELEKGGAVFFMNGNNGTEFDWYVNGKLPPFMIFYDDKANLGAAKLLVYTDGTAEIYLYDDHGQTLSKKGSTHLATNKEQLLKLAALLKEQADDQRIWDCDIAEISTDREPSCELLAEFQAAEQNYAAMKNRRNILNLTAYVSKKITQEGWKVGYMERKEPYNSEDSGWFFAAGVEEQEYFADPDSIELICVGSVWQEFDPDIFPHIDLPVGAQLIRISEDTFELDKNDKPIYTAKQ